MHAADKIAAAILASAAIKTLPGVRLNSIELEGLYRHFLSVVGEAPASTLVQPPLSPEGWNGKHQEHDERIDLGTA